MYAASSVAAEVVLMCVLATGGCTTAVPRAVGFMYRSGMSGMSVFGLWQR